MFRGNITNSNVTKLNVNKCPGNVSLNNSVGESRGGTKSVFLSLTNKTKVKSHGPYSESFLKQNVALRKKILGNLNDIVQGLETTGSNIFMLKNTPNAYWKGYSIMNVTFCLFCTHVG